MAISPAPAKLSGVDAFLVASRSPPYTPPKGASDSRLLWTFVGVSIAVHCVVLLLSMLRFGHQALEVNDEGAMDADVVTDLELPKPSRTTLPDAVAKPEAKVPVQLLPQLPQKFAVAEPTKADEVIPEPKAPEPPKEAKVADKPKEAPDAHLQTANKDDNKMDQAEILKRAAMERLRNSQKTAKTAEAPEKDDMARIADALAKDPKATTALAAGGKKGNYKSYGTLVRAAVSRNYTVPEAYHIKGASLHVIFNITVSERGELMDLTIKEPSGDAVFDDLAMAAVRSSVPLPKPPPGLAGEAFDLVFTP